MFSVRFDGRLVVGSLVRWFVVCFVSFGDVVGTIFGRFWRWLVGSRGWI